MRDDVAVGLKRRVAAFDRKAGAGLEVDQVRIACQILVAEQPPQEAQEIAAAGALERDDMEAGSSAAARGAKLHGPA